MQSASRFPAHNRVILFVASEGVLFGTVAFGYMKEGPGWLLLGWPFGLMAAFIVQGLILRAFSSQTGASRCG
jgi:hypothetical protein